MCKETKKTVTTQGFTLVELSIVIIIIGLLIAGISAGTSLINQASMNSVITDMQSYQTSYNNFVGRYNAIPGDFNNAFAYWGTACADTAADCNGNGNSLIDYAAPPADETVKAWKHLALANMISGVSTAASDGDTVTIVVDVPANMLAGDGYIIMAGGSSNCITNPSSCGGGTGGGGTGGGGTGNTGNTGSSGALTAASGGGTVTIGVDVPASKLAGAGYIMSGAGTGTIIGNGATAATPWTDNRTNAVYIGKKAPGAGIINSALKPLDAFNIDQKIDDGAISGGVFTGAQTGYFRVLDGLDQTGNCNNNTNNYISTTVAAACVAGLALN